PLARIRRDRHHALAVRHMRRRRFEGEIADRLALALVDEALEPDPGTLPLPEQEGGAVRRIARELAAFDPERLRLLGPIILLIAALVEAAVGVFPDQHVPRGVERNRKRRGSDLRTWPALLVLVLEGGIGGGADDGVGELAVLGDAAEREAAARETLAEEQ